MTEKTSATRVDVFIGEDDYLVNQAARQRVDALCPESEQTFGLEIIDGAVELVDEAEKAIALCLEALQTVSFFSEGKVVWLKGASFFGDSIVGRSAGVKERVGWLTERLKSGLAEGQHLVISAPKVDGRSAFYKACKSHTQLHEFKSTEKPRDAERSMREQAMAIWKEQKLKPERSEVMAEFLARAGTDTRQLMQESEKLAVYLGGHGGTVSLEDVRAIVSVMRDTAIWDLADAIGQREVGRALLVLRQLLFQRESAMGLIFNLARRFHDLAFIKDCMRRNWLTVSGSGTYLKAEWSSAPELDAVMGTFSKDPRKMHWYQTVQLCKQAQNFTLSDLVRIQSEISRTHESLVSGSLSDELLLELLLIKITPKAAA